MLDQPWLAFRLTSAVIVNGHVTSETDLEGWLAGRSDRWFAIESPGIALPIGRVASFGGTVVAQAEDGTWSASPQKIYDPWPTLDAAHAITDGAISCVAGSQTLGPDMLASLMSPLSVPKEAQGFLVVDSPGDVATGCRMTTIATWTSSKTTAQWSRDLTVSSSPNATPWPHALDAAGIGPTPTSDAAGPTPTIEANAGASPDGPAADASGAPSSQLPAASPADQSSEVPGSGAPLTVFGSLHYEAVLGPSVQPTFDVAPTSATYDPLSGNLSVGLGFEIGGRADGFLGQIQGEFAYGLTLKELVVDGTPSGSVPDISADRCQLTTQTSDPQASTCNVVLPLDSRPTDSVRLYFVMTGTSDPPEIGHTAFWATLIVGREP